MNHGSAVEGAVPSALLTRRLTCGRLHACLFRGGSSVTAVRLWLPTWPQLWPQQAPVFSHDPSFFEDLFLSHITECSGLTLWLSCCNCGISTGSFCWLCSWVSCPQPPSPATCTHARLRLLCFCPSVSALKTAACTWTPGSLPPPQGSSGLCLVSYVRNLVFVVLMYLLVQSSFTDKEVSKLLSPVRKSHTIKNISVLFFLYLALQHPIKILHFEVP